MILLLKPVTTKYPVIFSVNQVDYFCFDLTRSYNKIENRIDFEYDTIQIKIASEFKSKNNVIAIYPQENNRVVNFENLPIKN